MINNIKFFFKSLNKREKKTIYLSLIYIFFVGAIVSYFLFKLDIISLFSSDFFKDFGANIDEFYFKNKILFILIFSLGVFIWVFLLGIMSPVILLAGYIFGPFLATLIVAFTNSFAASIFFLIIRKFFKTILKKIITKKLKFIIDFLNKDINHYFLFYRILGGFGTPSPLQNLIPIFTKIKTTHFFIISFIGTIPLIFVWANFGQSIRHLTELDEINFSIFSDPKIYVSIILLALIATIPFFTKKILFKKKMKKLYK